MKRLLKMENVEVESMVVGVAVDINEEENTLLALFGGARVNWNYRADALPRIKNVSNNDKKTRTIVKHAILQRLAMDNIDSYSIESAYYSNRDNGIFLPLQDGVWLICYDNAYVRGQIDGRYFVWDPNSFKYNAVYVESLDFGSPLERFKIRRIVDRITKDYDSLASIIHAAENKFIDTSIDEKFFDGFTPNIITNTNTNTITNSKTNVVTSIEKNIFSLKNYTAVPESITTAACSGFDVEDSAIAINDNSKPEIKNVASSLSAFKLL